MQLSDYGWSPAMAAGLSGGMPARVTAVHKERYELVCDQGEGYGRLKAGVYFNGGGEAFPTTGDFVEIQYNPQGDSLILRTLPRSTFFSRRDPTPGRSEQAVAANFDTVFILQSLNHDFNERRLERYVTLAWQSGAVPAVVLTKTDLTQDSAEARRRAERLAAGVGVFTVSAKTGEGLAALDGYLRPGKTVVFLGSSGVGKSSLLNALAGEELMETGGIREDDSRGRHTTTHRQLFRLDSGAMVIDTPGMRELGMWDVSEGLSEAFTDVQALLGRCRFSDFRHQQEPGCAVREALETGVLSPERWESYQKLKQEARYADDKAGYLRQKQQWHKGISKTIRQMEKEGRVKE